MNKKPQLCLLIVGMLLTSIPAVYADVLQGQVEQNDTRLSRPPQAAPPIPGQVQQSQRISRPLTGGAGVVDTSAFSTPLAGKAQDNNLKSGVVQSSDFTPPPARNFDLGADRGSRELVLAWDRWHKQLSQAIYQRWSELADSPGMATVRVTVTKDRVITAQIMDTKGSPEFTAGLITAISGLNGNPGLSFPSKSERQQVSFEADYIASHDVTPGYSWVHNDYEHVKDSY